MIPKSGFIEKIYLKTAGDYSIGQWGESAIISDGNYILDLGVFVPEDQNKILEDFRAKLAESFEFIWGEKVQVTFDFELPGY